MTLLSLIHFKSIFESPETLHDNSIDSFFLIVSDLTRVLNRGASVVFFRMKRRHCYARMLNDHNKKVSERDFQLKKNLHSCSTTKKNSKQTQRDFEGNDHHEDTKRQTISVSRFKKTFKLSFQFPQHGSFESFLFLTKCRKANCYCYVSFLLQHQTLEKLHQ